MAFWAPCSYSPAALAPFIQIGRHSTYAKLNGHREEVAARQLCDLGSTLDAREIDVRGLDDALLALGGPDNLFGKAANVSYLPKRGKDTYRAPA